MPVADLFAPLERVVAKYRRDVHHLPSGAPAEALASLEGHLHRPLPPGLRAFLERHNGAALFRSALRIRAASDIAVASAAAPEVVLFADEAGVAWAWAEDGHGGWLFGRWRDGSLEALHAGFAGWLAGQLALLDTRVTNERDREALRLEADPDDPYQLVGAARRALAAGDHRGAERALRAATAARPGHAAGWQALGEVLHATDRAAARQAWLNALQASRVPSAWPGASLVSPDALARLAPLYADPEAWERELERFLGSVDDVRRPEESALVVAAVRALARSRLGRGRRRSARDALARRVANYRAFRQVPTPWACLIELADLEVDLGAHDEAEALVRRVQREAPAEHHPSALRVLARVAVGRQEPWAEEILADAIAGLAGPEAARARCVAVDRALRSNRADLAQRHLAAAQAQAGGRDAPRALLARLALAEGDVAHAADRREDAIAAWRRAGGAAQEAGEPDVLFRVRLREGDVALAAGDSRRAGAAYAAAVRGFADHELPVREAWALLRLARVAAEPEPLLTAARARFAEADHATGVAAIDALRRTPGASLGWHIERATAQARARHDAQRSRPPWQRADADRPERRMGAHRLAMAASGVDAVHAIAKELDACARAMRAGRGRAADPPVMRYIAAVDLLSGHMSFEASQVLLAQLLGRAVEGAAYRALQGAVARSPNAALIDGLLSTIERPREHPGPAVAAAADVLGLRRERAAVRALAALAGEDASPVARRSAIAALGRIGDRAVVDRVADALLDPALAEPAALALLLLGDRRGVDFHGRALADGRRDLSGSPGEIVGRYGGAEHLLLLTHAAQGHDERALGALQGLGLLGDPRAVPTLLLALASRERKVVEVAAGALQILTGQVIDIHTPGERGRFRQWWEANHERLSDGMRYRDGRLFGADLLLERMDDPEPYVRRTAYDELVISSGCQLPFDADGPWRVQRAHLKAWRAWWGSERHRAQPGAWYFDGRRLA